MPRTYLIRSNPTPIDFSTESSQDEDISGSIAYEEGSNTIKNIDYGDDPIDLSTSKSAHSSTKSPQKSTSDIQGYHTRLSSHSSSNWDSKKNQFDEGNIRDRFALPSTKHSLRTEPDIFLDERTRNSSHNIPKVPRNQCTREVFPDIYGRSSIDAFPFENDDVLINGYPSQFSRGSIQRASNDFKDRPQKEQTYSELTNDRTVLLQDLTRVILIEENSGMQSSKSSCMSLLEEYYVKAVAKRNIIRDLRRDLQLSDVSERKPRDYPSFQRKEQQYFTGKHASGSNPKHRELFSDLTRDLKVSSSPNYWNALANGPKALYKDCTASSHNTAPMYRPRWDKESNITSETEIPTSVTYQGSQGDKTCLHSKHLAREFPQTPQATLQSLRNAHLMWQQCQNSTRALGAADLPPGSEPTNLTLDQQSILQNSLVQKPQPFLHHPPKPSSTSKLQSKDLLMPPTGSRPTHTAPSQSSLPVCLATNEAISSTMEKSALPNGQTINSGKEDKTLKSFPGKQSKGSSTREKETQQRPDSTSVQILEKPSSTAGNEPVQPKPTISLRQKLRCNLCSSTFPTEKAYTKHMADDHKETKPHICGFCGKGFHDKFDLKRHHRTHTGVRPYKCSICPRAFTQRCSLETHVNKVHDMQLNFAFKERRKKIYVCEHCGNSVNDAFEHYLHMWDAHSRLAMPKRLRQKVLQRIKYILKSRNGSEKVGDELLANAQVVTQSICSLRELG